MYPFMMFCAAWLGASSIVAAQPVELPLSREWPDAGQTLQLVGRANEVDSGLTFKMPEASPRPGQLQIVADDMVDANYHWQTSELPDGLDDALLRVDLRGAGRDVDRLHFIRPDLHFYVDEDLEQGIEQWDSFPPASDHHFQVELVGLDDRVELWVDGRFLTHVQREGAGGQLRIEAIGAGELLANDVISTPRTARHLPVDIGHTHSQGSAEFSGLSLEQQGRSVLESVQLEPVALDRHVDVGLARWLREAQDSSSFYHPYYKRSAWDNVPETIMFSVPRRPYVYANVLCAVRTDGEREPTMSVRVMRSPQAWNGTGGTQGDTTVHLDPDAPRGVADMQQVGTVEASIEGQNQTLPVYLVKVPLRTDELVDFLQMTEPPRNGEPEDHFYIEFTRALGVRAEMSSAIHDWAPIGPQSGIVMLGLSLETAPVELMMRSSQQDLVFYREQSPALEIAATNPAQQAQRITLTASLLDYEGRSHDLSRTLTLEPGESLHELPLDSLAYGWYEGDFQFTDTDGEQLWRQRVSFVLLPEDTREATYEDSPFGIWWFAGSHLTESDPHVALPLVHKLGFRRVTPSHDKDPAPYHKYGVLPGMMGYHGSDDMEEVEQRTKEYIEKFPEVDWAMIYHETSTGGEGLKLPPELFGEEPEPRSEEHQQRFEELWDNAIAYTKAVRSVAPDMKIMLGNGGTNFNVHWLRKGFPREYWDGIGMEMAVQLFHPESQPTGWNLQSHWIAKRMRAIYGYDDLPITDAYEVDYRSTAPGALPPRAQADWYARDVLLSLAYELPTIYVGLLDDTNSSYYTSRWGATGVMERAPRMMPKPAYASLATLTLVLDQADYQRWIDTGSTATHCLEFRTDDGYVYAIWTSEGAQPLQLSYEDAVSEVTVVHSAGRRHQQEASETVRSDETPRYVISPSRVTSVERGEPIHEPEVLADEQTVDAIAPSDWRIVPGEHEGLEQWSAYKPLTRGDVTLEGEDELQLTLQSQPDVPDVVGRYVVIEPAEGPIAIEGKPDTVGVWVRGNGNWGRVMFELVDAEGRHWVSNGFGEVGSNGWDMSDWRARTSINFDGWRLITQPLPLHYPSGYYGPHFRDWRCVEDNGKSTEIAYPVQLNRLYVIMRERLVHVTDMVDAASMNIQLRDAVAGNTGRALVMQDDR